MMGIFLAALLMIEHLAPFTVVNGTGVVLEQLSIRPAVGGEWRPLGPGRLSPGARGQAPAPAGEDCAFSIRAVVGGTTREWADVNLCDVKAVTLNRRADGTLWIDYD